MNIFQKVGLLWKANKLLTEVKNMNQNHSYFSTEFVLTVISTIGTAWGTFHNLIPQALALKIMAGLVLGYTVCRSLVKAGQSIAPLTKTDKDDKIVAAMTQILDKLQGTFDLKESAPASQTTTVNVAPPAS